MYAHHIHNARNIKMSMYMYTHVRAYMYILREPCILKSQSRGTHWICKKSPHSELENDVHVAN